MNAAEYAVPAVLRGAMFVPRQAAGRREPARVTPGAFRAAGLPVPGHPAQRNVYQLTRRQGLPWTPGLDGRIRRRGGELLGHGKLILVDIDTPAAVDGTPMLDALRWLGDAAVEAGGLLDLSATVSVRTPGHPGRGHLPGWHLWYRADPGRPVRMGPLARCHAVELRARGTCPGSPGYVVWSAPGQLPVLPGCRRGSPAWPGRPPYRWPEPGPVTPARRGRTLVQVPQRRLRHARQLYLRHRSVHSPSLVSRLEPASGKFMAWPAVTAARSATVVDPHP